MIRLLHALFLALFFILSTSAATAKVTITYFHNDASGTPLLATDTAGNVVWKENHKPYGERVLKQAANNNSTNKIGFAGSPFDASTGLSYMGARYYDPVIGRFMGIDPVGFQEGNVHSFNRYAYANNNPYRYIDPDGRQAVELVWNRAFNTNRLIAPANGAPGFELAKQGIVQGLIEGAKLSAEVGMTVSPLGVAARTAKVGKGFVDGFRAVSKSEFDDIAKHGFRPDPSGRSMIDKWFSETRQGAEQFRNTYPELDNVVHTRVPKDVYDRSYKHPNIDNTGPGFCVQCSDLNSLAKP